MKRPSLALFPYAVFFLLLVVSWGRWIEPYVDSGRELMVPWRLAHGETLYRDIQFHHGPLAPYLAAALDRLAGRSLATRVSLAACLALLHLEWLRRLALRFLAPRRASLVTSLAVAVAVFLRPGGWLFPFSFDTAIAVTGLTGAVWFVGSGGRRDTMAAVCLLAALLSRPELGLAGVLILGWETRQEPSRWGMLAAAPLATATIPYVALSRGLPLERLVRDGWLALVHPPLAFRNVYRTYAGLDAAGLRLLELALASVILLLFAALLTGISAIASKTANRRATAILEILVFGFLCLLAVAALRPPERMARMFWLLPPLVRVVPLLVLAATAVRMTARLFSSRSIFRDVSDATMLMAALFAGRLLLAAGYVGPYDAFFLPLPLVVASTLALRAADAAAHKVGPAFPRLVELAFLLFLAFRVAAQWQQYRATAWSPVETAAGRLWLREPVATITRLALADLSVRVPAGGTLVGFPEGGFFNYVLGFSNPLPIEQFFPGHVTRQADEERIIRRLSDAPPNAILIANVLAVGESAPVFGRDYLVRLDGFLHDRFASAASFGAGGDPDARVGNPDFFVTIRIPQQSPARLR